jgi:protein TonB
MRYGFSLVFGVGCAFALHGGFFVFGGLVCSSLVKKEKGMVQQVELLSDADAAAEKKPDKKDEPPEKREEKKEELESQEEKAPDAAEIIRTIELSAAAAAPALEAASLSAIENALNGQGGGGGDFAEALSFNSGGRIGGTGKAGALDEKMESAFSLDEIDQKPRAVFQAAPVFPSEMRGKKIEGVVTLIFMVDAAGKVLIPKVEKSNSSAFDKPALDAIRRWKFEAAVKGGQRVSCRMRETIRFQPN